MPPTFLFYLRLATSPSSGFGTSTHLLSPGLTWSVQCSWEGSSSQALCQVVTENARQMLFISACGFLLCH